MNQIYSKPNQSLWDLLFTIFIPSVIGGLFLLVGHIATDFTQPGIPWAVGVVGQITGLCMTVSRFLFTEEGVLLVQAIKNLK